MEANFYVLLGDVVSSRAIQKRPEFQKILIHACNETNKFYKIDMLAPMEIIKGSDEIGCVLTNISHLYEIINLLLSKLGSQKMRFVLVNGVIDTGINSAKISMMDGPAFHKASNLMSYLKKEKMIFKMDTGNKKIDILITNNINLIQILKSTWSHKKLEIVSEYGKLKDQKKVAHKLELPQQTISYHITSSKWKEIKLIEASLKEVLKEID